MSHFFTDTWVLERTGRHRTTVKRWREAGRFPPELVRLAQLELDGTLGHIHARWDGWRLDRQSGELLAPNGDAFLPAELIALGLKYQQLAELKRFAANVRGTERDPSRPLRALVLGWVRRLIGRGRRRPGTTPSSR